VTRFSVVIPTYQRREVVARTVAALDRQRYRDFEVLVVVDGSDDGTAARLRGLDVDFPLRVLEQPNAGSARARNAGAEAAAGEVLLFLDDDMEADPALLYEHDSSQRDGADLVLGDLPVHPESPDNLLSWGVGVWAGSRRERLSAPGAEIELRDLLTGQTSITREKFERIGRFDESFTRNGLFGGADIDFGYRVQKSGLRVAFNPAAISYQYYDVDPAVVLSRSYSIGRSQQELILKHPEQAKRFAEGPDFRTRRSRWLLGPLVAAPRALSWPLRAPVVALVRRGHRGKRIRRLFFALRALEHKRGERSARKAPPSETALVLSFHAIADLSHDPALGEYGVPPERLADHLDAFAARGWSFIDLDALLRAVAGEGGLPSRAVLVTFDDGYADLLSEGCPVLMERRVPGVVFAVAGRAGGTNEWRRRAHSTELPLLDAEGLRAVTQRGVEVGSHAMTHRSLATVAPEELDEELRGSADALEALGLPRPRVLAYPYGEWSPEVAEMARTAGYEAAFTVTPGLVEQGADRYALPRIEVLASDTPRKLRLKVATAGWPDRWRKRLPRWLWGRS
jgi:glycosyltransferase involved in cell wall biosynthesis/peptidoglycan/xylan/chitin deacetylase (PgdA/CDA1 family)